MAANNSLIVITVLPLGTDVPGISWPAHLPLSGKVATLQSLPHMIWIKFQRRPDVCGTVVWEGVAAHIPNQLAGADARPNWSEFQGRGECLGILSKGAADKGK
jgi:hypothetical protein